MDLDPTLEKLFTESEYGFHLENRHFYAIYKTRLLKYDGRYVGEEGFGNIVSVTRLYPARNEESAKSKATQYFNVFNPTFRSLDRRKIDEVKHTLIEVKEYVPPTFKNENYRSFNKQEYSSNRHFSLDRCIIYPNRGEELPESFLGFHNCLIRRIQPHLLSQKATAYLYHPWHGARDNYTDWHRCDNGTGNYQMLELEFDKREPDEAKKFSVTEYTNLNQEEQELIRRLKRLQALDEQFKELCSDDTITYRNLLQGDFFNKFGEVIFIPKENSYLRQSYLGREEKVFEAKIKIKKLELERSMIEGKIKRLERFISEEEKVKSED